MRLSRIKSELKFLVTKDLGKALKKIESILNKDVSLYNDIILQQASFNGLERERLQGTISDDNANRRQKRIEYALVSMIDMVGEEDVNINAIGKATQPLYVESSDEREEIITSPPKSQAEKIYVSYAWKGKTEETADLEKIVDELDNQLQKRGLKIIRDKRDLGYRGRIKEFMEGIGKGDKIIVVISDKYLKSKNCMFELIQIYENKDFVERIFPIILGDADIYDPLILLDYIQYWNDKKDELQAKLSLVKGTHLIGIQTELNLYADIRASFDKIVTILQDMNALTPGMHQDQKFEELYIQLVPS